MLSRHGVPGKLDVVECARGLNKPRLKSIRRAAIQCGAHFAADLINLLIDDASLLKALKDDFPRQRSVNFTNEKYCEHFSQLMRFGLMEEETCPDNIRFFSTYFSVPKDALLDRAIFNGKRISQFFRTPPSVNLADVPRIIRELKKLSDRFPGGLTMIQGDFRHYFHQFELSLEASRLFGLAMNVKGKKRFFRYRGMPMGWSFSPAIAQGTSWTILCHHERDEETLIEFPTANKDAPPMFLYIYDGEKNVIGLVTVYYDNYLVAVADEVIARKISRRILRNAKHFGVEVKEHFLWIADQLTLVDVDGARKSQAPKNEIHSLSTKVITSFFFLGVEFGFCSVQKRERDGDRPHLRLTWRQKAAECTSCPALIPGKRTPREVAVATGKIIYGQLLTLLPLGQGRLMPEIINILRRVSSHAQKYSWNDQNIILSDSEKDHIGELWSRVTKPPWLSGFVDVPLTETAYLATDACDDGWGFVIIGLDGQLLHKSEQQSFPKELRDKHIYLKELYAVVQGVRLTSEHIPTAQKIIAVCDNTAVVGSIRRMYSCNLLAMKYIGEIKLQVHMVSVASDDNVADAPSRGLPFRPAHLLRTYEAIKLDERGMRLGCSKAHPGTKCASRIRHEEPDEGDNPFAELDKGESQYEKYIELMETHDSML